ncbi:PDZ domain-containing protein [Candidatus Fermentibacteria bacterium]|nr:PDZ domain-containing protein [Candidatus Fermentibacteria bacterium]
MKPRLLQVTFVGLVSAGLASADMARHEFVENPELSAEMDAFRCSCPKLSSRIEPMKIEREQGMVVVLSMSMPPRGGVHEADDEEEIATLGVHTRGVKDTDTSEAQRHGITVTAVAEGGAGKAAGLPPGDIILIVNTLPVHSSGQLAGAVEPCQGNDEVTLTVLHDGEEATRHVTLACAS